MVPLKRKTLNHELHETARNCTIKTHFGLAAFVAKVYLADFAVLPMVTRVPMLKSPLTAFWMLPGSVMLKTMIGRLLSMQSEMAEASIVDMYEPRKRLDVGTWGIMGIGMGFAVAAAAVTGKQVIAVEGDSAFGFSGMEVETICRYNLPVCVVVMNNNGIYKGTDVNPRGDAMAPTQFVKNARYDLMMEAFGGVGVTAKNPEELKKALDEAIASKRPTLINALIDETAGTESGRITSLNPAAAKKKTA